MSNDIYFGIDFGTTNSSMAQYDLKRGEAKILRNAEGDDKTPSLVYYGKDGEILVGKPVEDLIEDSEDYDEKERLDIEQRVQKGIKRELVSSPVRPLPGGKPVRPVEVVAEILKKLKREAEEGVFREEIERAVVTCPAVFDATQRKVIKDAATLAGFETVELVEEPVAAAMAFSRLGQKVGRGILVYDLGGGTFDVAVVTREEGGSEDESFRVATKPDGDDRCGGRDFDQAIYDYCDQIARKTLGRSVDVAEEAVNPYLLNECRKQKERLTYKEKATIREYLDGARFKAEIDLPTFEGMIAGRVEETVRKTASMVERARQRGHEVDTVVLIGGSSQVPLVKQRLAKALPVEPRPFSDKDYAVALGAAYHAFELWRPAPPKPKPDESRKAVKKALGSGQPVNKSSADELSRLASGFHLDGREAAAIEREVLGDTISAILAEQEEAHRLARKHDIDLSGARGSGKGGRVTRRDVEQYVEQLERKERERKELEKRRRQQQEEQERNERERREKERKEKERQEQEERKRLEQYRLQNQREEQERRALEQHRLQEQREEQERKEEERRASEQYRQQQATRESKPRIADLSRVCARYQMPRYYVGEAIPQRLLANARQNLQIPSTERVIALVDSSYTGNGKLGLAVCEGGLYWRISKVEVLQWARKYGATQGLKWNEFASITMNVVQSKIYVIKMGEGRTFIPKSFSVDVHAVAQLLQELQSLVR